MFLLHTLKVSGELQRTHILQIHSLQFCIPIDFHVSLLQYQSLVPNLITLLELEIVFLSVLLNLFHMREYFK
jgi:hypothetical protein